MIVSKSILGTATIKFKCGCTLELAWNLQDNSDLDIPISHINMESFTPCKHHKRHHKQLVNKINNNPSLLDKLLAWIYDEVRMTDYSITNYEELFDHYDEINAEMSLNDYLEELEKE